MSMSDHDTSLEQRIDALLRSQPLRSAPADLEARVLAAIAQRACAPWWQRSFMQWPIAARAAFLLVSLAFAGLGLAGGMQVTSALRSLRWPHALTQTAAWLHVPGQLARAAADTAAAVAQSIPGWWLDAAAAFGIALYLALFAVGAVAYRALHSHR